MVPSVSVEQVNWSVLGKHYLMADASNDDLGGMVADIWGLHATIPATPYLSLLARSPEFRRESLEVELYEKKTLVKTRCVRNTVYIVPVERLPAVMAATRRQVLRNGERIKQHLGLSTAEYDELSARVVGLMGDRGMTAKEIGVRLHAQVNISPFLQLMSDEGLLVRGAPAGSWKSNLHNYHVLESYLPAVDLSSAEEEQARVQLVEQYIASFGPVTVEDVAWWTAFPRGEVRKILEKLGSRVRSVLVEDFEADHFIIASDEDFLLHTHSGAGSVVNILPALDPYLMGYKVRERYLQEGHSPFVFDRSGNVTSTVLVDGRIVGVWDYLEKPEPVAKYLLLAPVTAETRQEIQFQLNGMGRFLAGRDVRVGECTSMAPLPQRTAGGFMSPLRDYKPS